MLGKLLLAGIALWMAAPTGNTAKTRNTEDRLNTAMPRIPWPQPYDGPAVNNSFGPGNTSYTSGNYSYPISSSADSIGGPDNGNSSWPLGGAPTAHYHSIAHGHYYGNLANDFNNLRNSYSDTVKAFNDHIGDHGNLVVAIATLRADHTNLLNMHNGLMFRLNATNLLQ